MNYHKGRDEFLVHLTNPGECRQVGRSKTVPRKGWLVKTWIFPRFAGCVPTGRTCQPPWAAAFWTLSDQKSQPLPHCTRAKYSNRYPNALLNSLLVHDSPFKTNHFWKHILPIVVPRASADEVSATAIPCHQRKGHPFGQPGFGLGIISPFHHILNEKMSAISMERWWE